MVKSRCRTGCIRKPCPPKPGFFGDNAEVRKTFLKPFSLISRKFKAKTVDCYLSPAMLRVH